MPCSINPCSQQDLPFIIWDSSRLQLFSLLGEAVRPAQTWVSEPTAVKLSLWKDRTRSGTKGQQAEILYFHCSTGLAFQSKASCIVCAGLAIKKCLCSSELQWNRNANPFPSLSTASCADFFLPHRPAAHRISASSMRKTRCWCPSKNFSSANVCRHLFTLCLHLSLHAPGLSLGEVTKIFGLLPFPIPEASSDVAQESPTLAGSQGWGVLSLCRHCSPTLQKFRVVGDSKSQLEVLFHTWLPWGWELGRNWRQFWDRAGSQAAASAVTCPTWLQITFPFLTCQGSNCLCPSCSWGKYYNLPGNGHCCSFQGKRTALIPKGCMLPLCSVLWFVRVFWFCCCGLSFSFLNSESRSSCWLWKLQTGTDRTEVPDYIKSRWPFLTRKLAPSWQRKFYMCKKFTGLLYMDFSFPLSVQTAPRDNCKELSRSWSSYQWLVICS